jgi:membrane-associated phospholipid phosphatase
VGEASISPVVERPRERQAATTPAARAVAMTGYVVVLGSYSKLVGLPADLLQVFGWMWLGTICWNVQAPPRSHLVFLRDWWPALAVLEVYVYSRGVTAHLGLPVHITEPIEADNVLGGGELPTQRLQEALCGTPCTRDLPARWYDGLLTCVYYTHFIAAPLVAFVLYLRNRVAWVSWMRRYVALYIAGLFFYITYPMAPPWMASDDGYISGAHISRITGRGWQIIGLEHFQQVLSRLGNQVAAMPSLHAATAALIACYGISRLRSPWRYLLALYPVAMSFMLVYYGEHYVVDIIAGALLAVVVMWACTNWERGGVLRQLPVAANAAILGPRDAPMASRTAPDVLTWLRRLPPVIVPWVLFVVLIVGLTAAWYAAIPALLVVGGFVGWVTWATWEELDQRSRVVRLCALATVALLVATQVLRLG